MLELTLNITNASINMTRPARICERTDRALVVGPVALVNKGHSTIALEVVDGDDGSVDGKLLVVDAETVTVGIGVGEETRLKDRVGGGFDVGNEVGRREGGLSTKR